MSNRIRQVMGSRGLASLIAVGVLAACYPTDPGAGAVTLEDLRVTAVLDEAAGSSVPCVDPRELVQDLANVTARAEIFDSANASTLETADLELRGTGSEEVLELAGEFDFTLLAVPTSLTLDLSLLYQGREIEGLYAGAITLESGVEIDVESFTIPPLSGGTVSDAELCTSSEAVEGGDVFCSTDPEIQNAPLSYDAVNNRFTYSYQRPNVDWLDEGFRTIVISIEGRLEPGPIYRGSLTIPGGDLFLANAPQEVTLSPVLDSGPGSLGERLIGTVTVSFADGAPPAETGTLVLDRVQRLACDLPGSAR